MNETDVRISDLDFLSDLSLGDFFPIVETGATNYTRKISFETISGYLSDPLRFELSQVSGNLQTQISNNDNDISGLQTATGELKSDLESSKLLISTDITGSSYTMQSSDEGSRIRSVNATSFELTLIEFSQAGTSLSYRQHSNISPTISLPSGMALNGSGNFTGLLAHEDCVFLCIDDTPGAQIVDVI